MVSEAVKAVKEREVERIAAEIRAARVIAIAALSNFPSKNLQVIRKKLRGSAKITVSKSSLIGRAFEKAGRNAELLKHLQGPCALIFTELSPFKLHRILKQSKGKAAAKPGQIAPYDLVVPAGETNIPPGPALGELKQAGINAAIQGGKVVVLKDSVVTKKGEPVSEAAARGLAKLGVEPFEIGLGIAAALEGSDIYTSAVLGIDEQKLLADMAAASASAFNLSVSAAYPTKRNINVILQKAMRESRALALGAGIYERDVIDAIIARANAQALALKSKANV